MTTIRNRLFLTGILFGSLVGLLTGSLVAFQVGSNREAMRETFIRFGRRKHQAPPKLRMV